MKLNNKRTILVGLAFLSICAFWQMYDNVVPLILTNTFHLNETFSGAIMAADNILALFLLPFFGGLSDRTDTKIGKRMPYILFGTGIAVILLNILPLLDNGYFAAPSTFKMVSFVIVLALLLIAMGIYRSPAVALMPDVTPKPLRSKANAIINLMGAVGGMIYLALAAVLYPNKKVAGLEHVNYQPLFMIVAAIMFVSVGILFLTIKEPKLTAENRALEKRTEELRDVLATIDDFSVEGQKAVVDPWVEQSGIKPWNAWRVCLVGEGQGPDMYGLAAFLGKDEVLRRMDFAISTLNPKL